MGNVKSWLKANIESLCCVMTGIAIATSLELKKKEKQYEAERDLYYKVGNMAKLVEMWIEQKPITENKIESLES